jgi:hypothetical protein
VEVLIISHDGAYIYKKMPLRAADGPLVRLVFTKMPLRTINRPKYYFASL